MRTQKDWFDLGVTWYNFSEMYEKAIDAFEKVEKISLERGGNWKYDRYYRAYCEALLLADKPESAIRISQKGLQIKPNDPWLIVYQGSSNVMLGDTLAAGNNISELRSFLSGNNYSKSFEELAVAYLYLSGKDTITAEKYSRKAYDLEPENTARIYNLSRILIRSGININEGLELAMKGLERAPDDLDLLWMKGLALHKLGKHEAALLILKEVFEKRTGYSNNLEKDIKEVEQAVARQKNN